MIRLLALLLLTTPSFAADPFPSDARPEQAARVAFTEGPAYRADGNVLFSDIVNNRIMRLDPEGGLHVFRTPSGRANGLLFDREGRLVACEGGGEGGNRRVTRTDEHGVVHVLADRYEGKRFNSPNDLAVDSKGRIYFTDPRYGDRGDVEQFDAEGNQVEGVYRIDADGKVARVITHEVDRPNGILVSPDDEYLFVADNVNDGPSGLGGNRKLWRFDLNADGTVDPKSRKLLFDWGTDRGPDGFCQDTEGRLYVTAGFNHPKPPVETAKKYNAGVYVVDGESGKLVATLPVPADMCTNCTFGGKDGKTLYVTAGHKLWSVPVNATGWRAWPPVEN